MSAKRPDYIFPLDHGGPQPSGAVAPLRHNLRHTATQATKFVLLQTILLITLSLFAHWFDKTMHGRTMLALMLGAGFAAGVVVRDRSALASVMAWLAFVPVSFFASVFTVVAFNDPTTEIDANIMFASWTIWPGSIVTSQILRRLKK
jgi:hypothetical protein